jgi:hypothetical protein
MKRKASYGARFGEYGVPSSIGICFLAKNWQTKITMCASVVFAQN